MDRVTPLIHPPPPSPSFISYHYLFVTSAEKVREMRDLLGIELRIDYGFVDYMSRLHRYTGNEESEINGRERERVIVTIF